MDRSNLLLLRQNKRLNDTLQVLYNRSGNLRCLIKAIDAQGGVGRRLGLPLDSTGVVSHSVLLFRLISSTDCSGGSPLEELPRTRRT